MVRVPRGGAAPRGGRAPESRAGHGHAVASAAPGSARVWGERSVVRPLTSPGAVLWLRGTKDRSCSWSGAVSVGSFLGLGTAPASPPGLLPLGHCPRVAPGPSPSGAPRAPFPFPCLPVVQTSAHGRRPGPVPFPGELRASVPFCTWGAVAVPVASGSCRISRVDECKALGRFAVLLRSGRRGGHWVFTASLGDGGRSRGL